jgi:hypothetical protein
VDIYAQHLKWQIASLINHRCLLELRLVVCHCSEDEATTAIIGSMIAPVESAGRFVLDPMALPASSVLRRGIGRNIAALNAAEDVVYFLDCDYYFGPGCLDALAEQITPDTELACPDKVQVNVDHATGDKMVDDARDMLLPQVDPSLFMPMKRKKAIGGLQIVGGNVARERGYLKDSKWTKPVTPEKGWRKTSEDVAFRRGRKTTFVSLPNLYWIRHEAKGQDMDAAGSVVGSQSW